MDEVIALAVGIPSVILAGLAVWYAKRNHAFQKMKLLMKKHKTNGGNLTQEQQEKYPGYNGSQSETWGGHQPGSQAIGTLVIRDPGWATAIPATKVLGAIGTNALLCEEFFLSGSMYF